MARVLIVDDDQNTVRMLSILLDHLGHEAIATRNPGEVHRRILQDSPDVILLDYLMPGTDGLKILQAIRATEEGRDVPIYLLTASQDGYLRSQLSTLGGSGYLTKPVDLDLLEKLLKDELSLCDSEPVTLVV